MYLKYKKLHDQVKEPQRANPSDAGLDLFFCPTAGLDKSVEGNFIEKTWGDVEMSKKFRLLEKTKSIKINPGENAILPTGITLEIPHGFVGMVCNRSSVSAKSSLLCGAHIVDAGYSGEIFVDLHNIGLTPKIIDCGAKIAQLLLLPVMSFDLLEDEEIYKKECVISNRKDGALGSTDERKENKKEEN